MAVELRPATAVLVLVAVLVAGSFGSIVVAEAGPVDDEADESNVNAIPLEGEEQQLWLYTSRGSSFAQPTLEINVVVYGDPDDVRRQLVQGGGSWNETESDEQDVSPGETTGLVNATTVEWETASGADRYVYLAGLDGETWLSEDYQVHDGTYLGSRHHVRAYTAPNEEGNWTAMQAHHEHWDWFMGRHVVTSVDSSQSYLENEFADKPGAPEITRVPVDSESGGYESWLTIVDYRSGESQVTAALLVVALGAVRGRVEDAVAAAAEKYPGRDARTAFLATGIVALFMTVRLAGITLEQSFDVPPKAFAFALYPVLFVGLPAATYMLSRHLEHTRAFAGASLGFLAAILVDYSYLGVANIPLDVLVHRGALAVALGMIAVGGSRTERKNPDRADHVRFGVLLWLVATILPLLRHMPLPV